MMYLLRFVLDKINQNYAITFPSINVMQIKQFCVQMKKAGFPVVPSDYVVFLSWTDGLSWNGLELFSIYPHDRPDTIYAQPTLMDYQKKYSLEEAFPSKLVLGRSIEQFICYDSGTKEYQLLDRFTYQPILKFSRFVDLLYYLTCYNGSVTSPTETSS